MSSTKAGVASSTSVPAPAAVPTVASRPRVESHLGEACNTLRSLRSGLQHERAALAWLLKAVQQLQAESTAGVQELFQKMQVAQSRDAARHAAALEEVKRNAATERSSAAALLTECQEERGEALLRAEQLSAETTRLREMLAQLKRQDDELYQSQSTTSNELRQLRAALAASEERVAASRLALDEEGGRRQA